MLASACRQFSLNPTARYMKHVWDGRGPRRLVGCHHKQRPPCPVGPHEVRSDVAMHASHGVPIDQSSRSIGWGSELTNSSRPYGTMTGTFHCVSPGVRFWRLTCPSPSVVATLERQGLARVA